MHIRQGRGRCKRQRNVKATGKPYHSEVYSNTLPLTHVGGQKLVIALEELQHSDKSQLTASTIGSQVQLKIHYSPEYCLGTRVIIKSRTNEQMHMQRCVH